MHIPFNTDNLSFNPKLRPLVHQRNTFAVGVKIPPYSVRPTGVGGPLRVFRKVSNSSNQHSTIPLPDQILAPKPSDLGQLLDIQKTALSETPVTTESLIQQVTAPLPKMEEEENKSTKEFIDHVHNMILKQKGAKRKSGKRKNDSLIGKFVSSSAVKRQRQDYLGFY